MKKMKKEIIILVAVIVVLLAYLLFKSNNSMHYAIPQLPVVKAESIDKIEIKKGEQLITLVKQDNKWFVAPANYPTEESKVTAVVGFIANLTLTDLVSESRNYSLYDLQPGQSILVKAYQKGQVLREFAVGKAAATYSHTYVKLTDDNNVYHARESFRSNFDVKMDDFRDKNVLKLDSNELTGITIERDGQVYVFNKKAEQSAAPAAVPAATDKPAPDFSWQTADGKKGNKATLDNMISSCSAFVCENYLNETAVANLKTQTPLYTVTFKGSKDYKLTFYAKIEAGEDNGKYPVISSENPYPFYVTSYKGDEIIKKTEDLFEKVETPEPAKKEPTPKTPVKATPVKPEKKK